MSGGIGLIDCDNDGKLDIVTVNGSTVDRYRHGGDPLITLYHQDSDLKFTDITKSAGLTRKGWEDVGLLSGIALSSDGLQQGSMGVDWGDYLHEGRLSMIVPNFIEQGAALYHAGKDEFSDVSLRSKVMRPTYPLVGWGTAFFDMDNDGWLDLFIANRHVYPQVDTIPGGTPYRHPWCCSAIIVMEPSTMFRRR
jgi:hypothetical protein